ncbi:hypothetical protein OCU04_006644 [Sclerotinia nivalis]|uniref:Uncharacterized protein n=1 Tax=Sclerotinia nivalis TaxID=352851 RepID=A0A9X0AL21_9HELO|nr:hypothetical protein OCU04_006644 [Sclerotinia nivalis]
MRKMNLFVKFEYDLSLYPVIVTIIKMKVPIFIADPNYLKNFKGTVMTHQMCYRKSPEVQNRFRPLTPNATSIIILGRHLHHLLVGLSAVRWEIHFHDDWLEHSVTLTDPYEIQESKGFFASLAGFFSTKPKEVEPFFTRKLQEKLIAPYRAILKAFPHFTFKGTIPEDLKIIASSEITLLPAIYDPDQVRMFLDNISNIKGQGAYLFNEGSMSSANGRWEYCRQTIEYGLAGDRGKRLRKSGGVKLMNSLAEIYFDLAYLCAQSTILLMHNQLKGHPSELETLPRCVRANRFDFEDWTEQYAIEITWQPDPIKLATLFYREAVCFRLSMVQEYLTWALRAIDRALQMMPNNLDFLIEKEKILIALTEIL